jgi:hypothetical protein
MTVYLFTDYSTATATTENGLAKLDVSKEFLIDLYAQRKNASTLADEAATGIAATVTGGFCAAPTSAFLVSVTLTEVGTLGRYCGALTVASMAALASYVGKVVWLRVTKASTFDNVTRPYLVVNTAPMGAFA